MPRFGLLLAAMVPERTLAPFIVLLPGGLASTILLKLGQ
jgi:hypothetical protein